MRKAVVPVILLVLIVALAACAAPAPTATPPPPPPTTAPVQPTAAPAQPTAAPTAAAATKAPATTAPTTAPATAPAATTAPTSAAAKGSIKIGVIAPTTGNFAANGQTMINGWKLWFDKNGYTVAGRQIEVFYEDDAANPDTTLSKARLLVDQRQVNMIVGPLSANTGLALAEYAKSLKIPVFMPIVSADDLTQRARVPNVIRIAGWTSSQTTHPFGEWAYQKGYRKAVTVGQDFAFGHETVGGFTRTFSESGGQILAQIWHPIGAPDFGPYFAQIQSLNPDVVFIQESGGDTVKFIKSWSDFGLKGKIALLTNQTATDQSALGTMGPEAEGIISVGHYAEGRDDPVTQAFVADYDKAYQKLPSYYAADMYTAARIISEAIAKVNGNVEDTPNFIKVVTASDLSNTPMGPEKMDDYGNPIENVYLRQVAKRPD
ncbi:MAG TPA: penicillin-binding protein activator, partial [Anaerolineales bacterium]